MEKELNELSIKVKTLKINRPKQLEKAAKLIEKGLNENELKQFREEVQKLKKELIKLNRLSPDVIHYEEFGEHVNSLFGYFNRQSNFKYFVIISPRKAGKTYIVADRFLNNNAKCHDNVLYYFRLTEAQSAKLLANNAEKMFDPPLRRKYFESRGYTLKTKGNSVYAHKVYTRNGKTITETKPAWKVAEVGALSTFYTDKGVATFDHEFLKMDKKHMYWIFIDEFQKELGERNQGDLAYQFIQALHNKIRDSHYRVRVFMMCNNLRESSEILSGCFNFMPIKYGIYKLHKQKCIIDYWQPTEYYKKMMGKGATSLISSDDTTFTNEFKFDMELVTKQRRYRPSFIIRFSKDDKDCFIVWDDRIIKRYVPAKKSKLPNVKIIPMVRFTDEKFSKELQKAVFEQVDNRNFLYSSLMDKTQFENMIKLIRPNK